MDNKKQQTDSAGENPIPLGKKRNPLDDTDFGEFKQPVTKKKEPVSFPRQPTIDTEKPDSSPKLPEPAKFSDDDQHGHGQMDSEFRKRSQSEMQSELEKLRAEAKAKDHKISKQEKRLKQYQVGTGMSTTIFRAHIVKTLATLKRNQGISNLLLHTILTAIFGGVIAVLYYIGHPWAGKVSWGGLLILMTFIMQITSNTPNISTVIDSPHLVEMLRKADPEQLEKLMNAVGETGFFRGGGGR